MATLIPKPKSPLRNKRLLFLIILAALLFTGVLIGGAVCFHQQFKQLRRLRNDLSQTQFTISEYRRQVNQLSSEDNFRISKLQQYWTEVERKVRNQEEHIRKLDHLLPQNPPHLDRREANLLEELKTHKEMYIQVQQKNQLYEQQLLALTQEIRYYKDQNQLTRQEQLKIRAEHQELLNQRHQVSEEQQQLLKKPLQLRLSQLTNADYELEQKLQEVQKAVESCTKIGELKALEVYYDDKLENLSRAMQKSENSTFKNLSENSQFKQLKQDFIKLTEEEEKIKETFNKLGKAHEERLKALENQDHMNVMSARPVAAPVQPPEELLKEAVKNYNILSKSGQNKKELKEMKKNIKELHHQINQQPKEIHQKIHKDTMKQNHSQETQTEQILEDDFLDQNSFERQLGNDIANFINAFVDLYQDL